MIKTEKKSSAKNEKKKKTKKKKKFKKKKKKRKLRQSLSRVLLDFHNKKNEKARVETLSVRLKVNIDGGTFIFDKHQTL